jgi:serine/threonine-protein kinase HipA
MDSVEVRIWGQAVGAVAADPQSRAYAFEYYPRWKESGVELAPLMMPVGDRRSTWTFPAAGEGFVGLPGLLADALPDAFGNRLIETWMAAHGVVASQITAIDRLAYMARRGMGALEFRPPLGARTESAKPLEMSQLVEEARRAVSGDVSSPTRTAASLKEIIRVGTSAGGARAKAVIAWNPATNVIRSGQFEVPDGFEHWLLKFDGVGHDSEIGSPLGYGRIEYAYALMAAECGIAMSPSRLLEENGRAHFMTRRFDRDGNQKHHVQSLCALAHLDYKQARVHSYEQLFIVAKQLGLADAELAQLFHRMVFNYMARNCDDHTKNFAFMMAKGGRWGIAPAYDVTYSYNPASVWVAEHQMSVNGKFRDAARADFLMISDRYALAGARSIIDKVASGIARWPEHAASAGIPADRVAAISSTLQVV